METNELIKKEVEIAEDIKGFIDNTIDVEFQNNDLKKEIFKYDDDTLLLVEKKIASPTLILGVEEITESLVNKYFN